MSYNYLTRTGRLGLLDFAPLVRYNRDEAETELDMILNPSSAATAARKGFPYWSGFNYEEGSGRQD